MRCQKTNRQPSPAYRKRFVFLLRVVVSRIVFGVEVFEYKRPQRGYLRDVLAGFRPVEMGRVARENDHRAERLREAGALSDLDNVTVRIADVAANLAILGDRFGNELGASTFP